MLYINKTTGAKINTECKLLGGWVVVEPKLKAEEEPKLTAEAEPAPEAPAKPKRTRKKTK